MAVIQFRESAALWSQVGYPNTHAEHSLRQKVENIAEAGFDSVMNAVEPGLVELLSEFNLDLWGYINAAELDGIHDKISEVADAGARILTVHLLKHDTPPAEAVKTIIDLVSYAKQNGVRLTIETHRNTATETPEKFEEIAHDYQDVTGQLLPVTWDFSHFATVKHLMPDDYSSRLLAWPEIIRNTQLFHCRPFNGHHCQVPVTDPDGSLTSEANVYLAFVKELFTLWASEGQTNTDIYVCPEMGPADAMGYNLSTLPNSWEDAKVLRTELRNVWDSVNDA